MVDDLSRKLIHAIKEKTPCGMTPVNFLIETLPMQKEAAYRRLRNEIPLTLSEAGQISRKLNVSLDELVKYKEEDTYKISMAKIVGENMFTGYGKTMQQIIDILKTMQSDPATIFYSAINRHPYLLLFNYPTLSKFRLYISNYQLRKEIMPKTMSDFVVPDYIRELEKSYSSTERTFPTHYIWTKNLFASFTGKVQYFSETGLLSKEEINQLKDEAHDMLDTLERSLATGKLDNGTPFFVYLSTINIDNNYIYVKSSNFETCSINVFEINFFFSSDPELCKNMKDWIQSLAKYSVLMSQAGVVERTDFINRQRDLLQTLK